MCLHFFLSLHNVLSIQKTGGPPGETQIPTNESFNQFPAMAHNEQGFAPSPGHHAYTKSPLLETQSFTPGSPTITPVSQIYSPL